MLGKVAVVGAGAIGSYYGARLVQAGEDVTFLLRSDYDHVRDHGLVVKSCAGDFTLDGVQCARSSEEIGPVDLVIVAWKATANAMAEQVIGPLVGEETTILTLQNGLGNVEHLGGLFGVQRVVAGLCFVCINRLQAGLIAHTASGLIRMGEALPGLTPRLDLLASAFKRAKIPCEVVEELERALWMKLVWNFPFNGLAIAEGGVDTQVLLHERGLGPQVRAIMAEVIAVAAALGHEIPQSFIDHQMAITEPMGPYRPSSMIDYVEGRAVEFEVIWKIPLETARRVGVAVPEMEALVARIEQRLA